MNYLLYWKFANANQGHSEPKPKKYEQVPDQFGTLNKIKRIIKPDNIFFQEHAKPDPNNYPEDFDNLKRLHESIIKSGSYQMANIMDPRQGLESYDERLALLSPVNLGNGNVCEIADRMQKILKNL